MKDRPRRYRAFRSGKQHGADDRSRRQSGRPSADMRASKSAVSFGLGYRPLLGVEGRGTDDGNVVETVLTS